MSRSLLTLQKLTQIIDDRKRIIETFPDEDVAAPVRVPPVEPSNDSMKDNVSTQKTNSLLSPELKIKHKKSGHLYTIHSVNDQEITLRSPVGRRFTLNRDEIEKEYVLD